MKRINKIKKVIVDNLELAILLSVGLLCAIFLICGSPSENGSITLDSQDAQIQEYTTTFIEDANAALNRIMNEDAPTDEETIEENSGEATGKGFYTTIDDILGRVLPDGSSPYQCSRYTAYLGTGRSVYSTSHIDYGPVNGKDIAAWLVNNYGYKYIDKPIKGAIGSGGFNTLYGHTALYLYSTGANTAMVSDANYVPLAVATHEMNISGWVWVVPGSYDPEPTPTPEPTPEPQPVSACKIINVAKGDTMGAIMKRCKGVVVWGQAMNEYADKWISSLTGKSVYYGWTHNSGYGLFANDTITYTGD